MEMINVLNKLTELAKENTSPDVKQAVESTRKINGAANINIVEEHITESFEQDVAEATANSQDPVKAVYRKAIDKYFGAIHDYGDSGLEILDSMAPTWNKLFDKYGSDFDTMVATTPQLLMQKAITDLKNAAEYCEFHLEPVGDDDDVFEQGVAEGNKEVDDDLDSILARYPNAVKQFKQGGSLDYDLEVALWDYYYNRGDIRNYDADASEWIAQQLADELGIQEMAEGEQQELDESKCMEILESYGMLEASDPYRREISPPSPEEFEEGLTTGALIGAALGVGLGAKGAWHAGKKAKMTGKDANIWKNTKNFVQGIVDPRTYIPKKKKSDVEQDVAEVITKNTPAGDIIKDFKKSKNPKFKGKSKEKRKKQALGAYYGMHPEKSRKVGETKLTPKKLKKTFPGSKDMTRDLVKGIECASGGKETAARDKHGILQSKKKMAMEMMDLKKLAGLTECGMAGPVMGSHTPANISINASAGSGAEVASMLRDLMHLAGEETQAPEIAVMDAAPCGMEEMVDEGEADGHFADATTEPAAEVYDENPVMSMTGRQVQTPNGNARQNDNPLEESLWNKYNAEK